MCTQLLRRGRMTWQHRLMTGQHGMTMTGWILG